MLKRKRVAVIFFGQPRNIKGGVAALSHRFWLWPHKIDYFGHVWYGEKSGLEYTVGLNVDIVNIPVNAPRVLRNQYPGIQLIVEEPRTFDLDDYESVEHQGKNLINEKNANQRRLLPVFFSQYYSISQALNYFSDNAKVKKYDFIVLSRYDNFIISIPNLAKSPTNRLIVNNARLYFHDYIFIGNWPMIKALDVHSSLNSLLQFEADYSPEEMKRASFFTHFQEDDVLPISMNVTLIRGESLFELFKYWLRNREHRLKSKIKKLKVPNFLARKLS